MAGLTKSQRVHLIQSLSERLEAEDWTTIDLTLSQFSFPTSNQWSGDKKSYVIEMVSDAKEGDLIELAEHFGLELPASVVSVAQADASFWEEGKLRTFISHLSAEKKQAAELQSWLSQYGMTGFVAHNDIHPNAEWQIEIETALATCELLVALIHPNFIQSQWCDQEIGYALGRGIPVFTVRCGADPYGFVSRFQAFNGNGKTEQQISLELFEAARTHKKLQARMASVLVDMFVNSGSFATAKARITYLETLPTWNSAFSQRLLDAVDQNSQISGSWGVPERVKALIEKWK